MTFGNPICYYDLHLLLIFHLRSFYFVLGTCAFTYFSPSGLLFGTSTYIFYYFFTFGASICYYELDLLLTFFTFRSSNLVLGTASFPYFSPSAVLFVTMSWTFYLFFTFKTLTLTLGIIFHLFLNF